jgi:hypothetical protein
MDMFLDHKVQENALGKLTAVKKKEKRRKTGLVKKAGGARIYAVIMTITDHRWVRDRARVSSMDTPYSIGKGKTSKCKGNIREVRAHYIEREGGYGACKMNNTKRKQVEQQ